MFFDSLPSLSPICTVVDVSIQETQTWDVSATLERPPFWLWRFADTASLARPAHPKSRASNWAGKNVQNFCGRHFVMLTSPAHKIRQRSRNRVSQRHLGEPRDLRSFGTVPSSSSPWGGVVAASSAIRPDSPETGGVALPGLRPGSDLHNQGNAEGDGGGGEGTKRGRLWGTKQSHAMRWWSSFLRAHNIDMSSHSSPWAKRGACDVARYAEKKCACNAVYVHTSPSLTRESLFLMSETHVQKMSQLGSIFTVDVVATISLGLQLFPICTMNTMHPLRHLRCSCQRPSCHSSLLQQRCGRVDAEAVDVSEKASFQFWLSHSSNFLNHLAQFILSSCSLIFWDQCLFLFLVLFEHCLTPLFFSWSLLASPWDPLEDLDHHF